MNLPVTVIMRIHVVGFGLAVVLAHSAIGQRPAGAPPAKTAVGTWRGTSVCLVRPSACNDESVVYRITPMTVPDSVSLDARKIVRGEEQEMGVLGCRLVAMSGEVTCTIPRGVWRFTARNDSLTGELRLADNTRFREVRAVRAP